MAEDTKSYHWDSGKGSRPREYSVTQTEFGKKFDAIDWSVKSSISVKVAPVEESGCGAESEVTEAALG